MLMRYPEKVQQALQIRKEIAGIPFAANSWLLAAHGEKMVEAITVSRSGASHTLNCDYVASGFHLVPNAELAMLLGCKTSEGCVHVNELQQTTVEGVFCAGEPTGIGGVELALIEGQIAGLAATARTSEAQTLFREREKSRRFARVLNETFRLCSELKALPSSDTLVCRCEDVAYARLREPTSWRAAKLHTRCGMGPCQGRICGPATEFLFGWNPDSVRPPVLPVRVESLAAVPTRLAVDPSATPFSRE